MKISLIAFLFLLTGEKSFCQKDDHTIESFYNASINGVIEKLPSEISPDITISAKVKVIRNKKFCVLIVVESSLANPAFSTIAHSENDGDTLLFDMTSKKVYSFSEKKSYWYIEKDIKQVNILSDTIKKADTVIILSKTLNKQISPTPTLKEMNNGILSYSTNGFSFHYLSSQTSSISLEAIYNRCKDFTYTNQKTEFIY
jgi:hypothetical protein